MRRVMVTVEGFPAVMVAGEKDFSTVRAATTFKVSVAAEGFETPWSVVIFPAGIVLVRVPVKALVGAVTGTTTVQVESVGGLVLAGSVPPVSSIRLVPATAVSVPPQLLTGAGEAAITSGAGRLSVKCTPV